jgi:hypothetical protein
MQQVIIAVNHSASLLVVTFLKGRSHLVGTDDSRVDSAVDTHPDQRTGKLDAYPVFYFCPMDARN